jgi:methionyl-tRNA synthetase
MSNAFYVTSPIYYVNDVPHIGHAYTNLACDVMARYERLLGKEVYFLTGTDEHGQKVEKTAIGKGMAPLSYCDAVSEYFRHLATRMQCSHHDFIRTTEPRHVKAAQAMWERLQANGMLYLGSYAGWYSVRDEAFFQEAELIEGKAPTGAPVEWVEEPSYFFRLSQFQDRLLAWYEANPDAIWPASRRNEVIRFVEGGLKDLSVSRSTFKWGVPVPGDEAHVMYVWLDALTNYISALGFPDDEAPLYQQFWAGKESVAVHVVGKDILRFHAVYWPAFLMAAGLPLPKQIVAHGWWTNEGEKISKSLGNVIDPLALMDQYGLDPVRYFLMREVPFGSDGNFSHDGLKRRINSELANTIGNLAQRSLKMVQAHFAGKVPEANKDALASEHLLQCATETIGRYKQAMAQHEFHLALEAVQRLGVEANSYIDREAPWQYKNTDLAKMGHILYVLMEAMRTIGVLLLPFIPESAGRFLGQLGMEEAAHSLAGLTDAHRLVSGSALPEPQIIFPRAE